MKIQLLLAFAVTLNLFASSVDAVDSVQTRRFPEIRAETLNEREVVLPRDLPADPTIVLIAFEQSQQAQLDRWIKALNLDRLDARWIETPVIDPQNVFIRGFINAGMRRGIGDTLIREKTITLYFSREEFVRALKLDSGIRSVYVALVTRGGEVIDVVEGDPNAERVARVRAWQR